MKAKKFLAGLLAAGMVAGTPITAFAEGSKASDPLNEAAQNTVIAGNSDILADAEGMVVFRLYNTANQEHLFTTDQNEAVTLVRAYGWNYEGSSWTSPESGTPVYRLYCSATNAHLFTSDTNERDTLLQNPVWSIDNSGDPLFYSDPNKGYAIYRVYHEGIRRHLLTTNKDEYDVLVANGWNGEGIKFYCSALGDSNYHLDGISNPVLDAQLAILREKAPIYAAFNEETINFPVQLSMVTIGNPGGDQSIDIAVSSLTKLAVNIKSNGQNTTVMLDGNMEYVVDYIKKEIIKITLSADKQEELADSMLSSMKLNFDPEKAAYSTGEKIYNGKKYLYERIESAEGPVYEVYADTLTKSIKYTVVDDTAAEIKSITHEIDSNIFKIPSGYKIIADIKS